MEPGPQFGEVIRDRLRTVEAGAAFTLKTEPRLGHPNYGRVRSAITHHLNEGHAALDAGDHVRAMDHAIAADGFAAKLDDHMWDLMRKDAPPGSNRPGWEPEDPV